MPKILVVPFFSGHGVVAAAAAAAAVAANASVLIRSLGCELRVSWFVSLVSFVSD